MVDTRHLDRDSLFLLADIYVDGAERPERIKVRNLSSGGMMAEGAIEVLRDSQVTVELRNIGAVRGSVAWVQGRRFGVAFERQIDAKLARMPVATGPADGDTDYGQRLRFAPATAIPRSKLRRV